MPPASSPASAPDGAEGHSMTHASLHTLWLPISEVGLGLILLGFALMVVEAFLPSFGVVGVSGIAAFFVGLLLVFDAPIPDFGLPWPAVILAAVVGLALLLLAVLLIWRAHQRNVVTGEPALIGLTGRVVRWHGHRGTVHVRGEEWQAQSNATLSPGEGVRVAARNELLLIVEPVLSSSLPQR
jgi:membrane-bound serine protease (ClpP class)